jgi:hypothetical protein
MTIKGIIKTTPNKTINNDTNFTHDKRALFIPRAANH